MALVNLNIFSVFVNLNIENDPLYLASVIVKSSKKNAFGNVKEAKRKTIVKVGFRIFV